jgi:hypothetical protein
VAASTSAGRGTSPGVLDPAAAEGAVQVDQAGQAREPGRHQRRLRAVEAVLRVSTGEIARHAVAKQLLRQVERALLGLDGALDRRELVAEGAARREPVGDLAERGLDPFSYARC